MQQFESIDFNDWIPVFPLPNAVLMPRTILPLHVFEQRYRAMTRDVLGSSHVLATALLKPGHESQYHTLESPIHPIVCVCRIFREEELADGRYNFLAQGVVRARILEENTELSYRRACLQAVVPVEVSPEVEAQWRTKLRVILHSEPLLEIATSAHWLEAFDCPDLNLSDLVDVLSAAVLQDPEDRQAFLVESDTNARAGCLHAILQSLASRLEHPLGSPNCPRQWPPCCSEN